MNDRVLRILQRAIRVLAAITLIVLVLLWLEELNYAKTWTVLASSQTRATILYWTIGISLSLPFAVGVEGWLIRKNKLKNSRFWLDLTLAMACFTLFVGLIFYSLSHLRML